MYLAPENAFHITNTIELQLDLSNWKATEIVSLLQEIEKATPNWSDDLGIVKTFYNNPGITFGPLKLESNQFEDAKLVVKLGVYLAVNKYLDTLKGAEKKLSCAGAIKSCADYLREEIEKMPKEIKASLNAIMAKKMEKREKCFERAFLPVSLLVIMILFLYNVVNYKIAEKEKKLTFAFELIVINLLILNGILWGSIYYYARARAYRLEGGVDHPIKPAALWVVNKIGLKKMIPEEETAQKTAHLKKTN